MDRDETEDETLRSFRAISECLTRRINLNFKEDVLVYIIFRKNLLQKNQLNARMTITVLTLLSMYLY